LSGLFNGRVTLKTIIVRSLIGVSQVSKAEILIRRPLLAAEVYPKPDDIDNSPLLCEHDKLIFDFERMLDDGTLINDRFALVPQDLYSDILELYNCEKELFVSWHKDGTYDGRETCEECLKKLTDEHQDMLKNFRDANISLEVTDERSKKSRATTTSQRRRSYSKPP
jgi:hypothetical protein